ncbi:MAG: hydroxymethylbilane synthase, partial [Solirubrobacteraceae bacterium]|nr:hydroxymethylbilane synthase [Solirubrobacteraceae bacterium]
PRRDRRRPGPARQPASVIRLGTRGSALALAQARTAAALLGGDVEIVEITTSGDRDRAMPDKEKWVKELDRALVDGEIDMAVHSAKDVPGVLADGIVLAAALTREDPRDALIGAATLAELPQGARVGTSSLRRAGQLLALRPDLVIEPLRGNIDTRLRIVREGPLDAAILAQAGLNRIGRGDEGTPLDELVPAPGQGIVVLTSRIGDAVAAGAAMQITQPGAFTSLRAERAIGLALGADCTTAIGAHASPLGDERIELRVKLTTPSGDRVLDDLLDGPIEAPEELARSIATRLRAAGADDLLESSR